MKQLKSSEHILTERKKEAEQNYYRYFIVSKKEVRGNPQLLNILEDKRYAVEPIYDGFKCIGYKVYFDGVNHAQLFDIEWLKKNYIKQRKLAVLDRFFGGLLILGTLAYVVFLIMVIL